MPRSDKPEGKHVKVAFVGKGGSGKTTLAALFARYLRSHRAPVWAIDADINQHLGAALGAPTTLACPPLGDRLEALKEYLRGSNPRISSAAAMVKTTPPGSGSRLLRPFEPPPVLGGCVVDVDDVRLSVTGAFDESDLGVACYHSKVGAVELILNHLVDADDEYVVVDMTAGADAFASGLFTRFDLVVVVVEPTLRSVGVYRQFVDYAADFDIAVRAVGNKVGGAEDRAFLNGQIGDAMITQLGVSRHVRGAEQGQARPIEELEPRNRNALAAIRAVLDNTPRDWDRYTRHAVQFHLRNAVAWANARVGEDLSGQVDPTFVLGPAVLDRAVTPGLVVPRAGRAVRPARVGVANGERSSGRWRPARPGS
jgi:CO dehydrogenase maturation factor